MQTQKTTPVEFTWNVGERDLIDMIKMHLDHTVLLESHDDIQNRLNDEQGTFEAVEGAAALSTDNVEKLRGWKAFWEQYLYDKCSVALEKIKAWAPDNIRNLPNHAELQDNRLELEEKLANEAVHPAVTATTIWIENPLGGPAMAVQGCGRAMLIMYLGGHLGKAENVNRCFSYFGLKNPQLLAYVKVAKRESGRMSHDELPQPGATQDDSDAEDTIQRGSSEAAEELSHSIIGGTDLPGVMNSSFDSSTTAAKEKCLKTTFEGVVIPLNAASSTKKRSASAMSAAVDRTELPEEHISKAEWARRKRVAVARALVPAAVEVEYPQPHGDAANTSSPSPTKKSATVAATSSTGSSPNKSNDNHSEGKSPVRSLANGR